MSERMNLIWDDLQWAHHFGMNSEHFYISLGEPECYNRILFVDPETKRATYLPEEAEYMELPEVVQMIRAKMQGGALLYVCSPEEKMPHKVILNEEGMPSIQVDPIKEPADAPVEPKKPNLWKRFANTITGGKAYKEDFTKYEQDMNTYRDQLDAHMKEVDEYALALPAIKVREDRSEEIRERDKAYKAKKMASAIFVKAVNERERLTDANEIGKNTYEQLFAPDAQPPARIHNGQAITDAAYVYPYTFTKQQVTALAFACTLSDEALSGIQWTSSSIMATQLDAEQAKIKNQRVMLMENLLVMPNDTRHAGLTDAIINGRNMVTEISEQYEQGNMEPMGRVLNNAVNAIVQSWRCATRVNVTRNVAMYGFAMENLKACLEIPGMKEAAHIEPDVLRQMDAAIAVNQIQQRYVGAASDMMYVNFSEGYREQRNLLTEQVIAKKLFDIEFERQHQAMVSPVYREKMSIADEDPNRLGEGMDNFVAWEEKRPLLSLEEQLLENPGKVMAEFREKARQSDLYREMCSINDSTEFKRMAIDLVNNEKYAQLSREPVSVNELGGRTAQQPQASHERVSAHTMSHEADRQMNQ